MFILDWTKIHSCSKTSGLQKRCKGDCWRQQQQIHVYLWQADRKTEANALPCKKLPSSISYGVFIAHWKNCDSPLPNQAHDVDGHCIVAGTSPTAGQKCTRITVWSHTFNNHKPKNKGRRTVSSAGRTFVKFAFVVLSLMVIASGLALNRLEVGQLVSC